MFSLQKFYLHVVVQLPATHELLREHNHFYAVL